MAFQCFPCGTGFSARRDWKQHMAGEPHHFLNVICPWCMDYERTCNRIADLKKHLAKAHPGLDMVIHPSMFTEQVGFYLCNNPVEYARIAKPAPYSADSSTAAMNAIRAWLAVFTTPSRELGQWELGWTQAIGTPLHSEAATPACTPRGSDMLYAQKITGTELMAETPAYDPNYPEIAPTYELLGKYNQNIYLRYKDTDYVITVDENTPILSSLATVPDVPTSGPVPGELYSDISMALNGVIHSTFINHIQTVWTQPPQPLIKKVKPNLMSLSQRAKKLLSTGAMPMLPPARRDWNVGQISIRGKVNSINWPPAGWEGMDKAKRLQAFEYGAMHLDVGDDGVPATPRNKLCATYNYLALPGSAEQLISEAGQKLRLYNYEVLRNMANTSRGDEALLHMLELAVVGRDSSQDNILEQIKNVPLRLK